MESKQLSLSEKTQLDCEDISGREALLSCFPDGKADLAEGEETCTRSHSQAGEGPGLPLWHRSWRPRSSPPELLLPRYFAALGRKSQRLIHNRGTHSQCNGKRQEPGSKGSTIPTVQNYRHQEEIGERENTGQTLRSGEMFLFLNILFGTTPGPHTKR